MRCLLGYTVHAHPLKFKASVVQVVMEYQKKTTEQGRNYTTMFLRITIPTSLDIFPSSHTPQSPTHTTPAVFTAIAILHNTMFSHTSISHYNVIICGSKIHCTLNIPHPPTTTVHTCHVHQQLTIAAVHNADNLCFPHTC